MDNIKKCLNNTGGFTLVEALVTIMIVGIVVAPLTMVFIGTIDEVAENDDRLAANQLGQMYLESMKARTYQELIDQYFYGVSVDATDTYYSTPEINGNYEVTALLSYGGISQNGYTRPVVTPMPTADITITYLNNGTDDIIKVTTSTGHSFADIPLADIIVKYEKSGMSKSINVAGLSPTISVSGGSDPVINIISEIASGIYREPLVTIDTTSDVTTDKVVVNHSNINGATVKPDFKKVCYPTNNVEINKETLYVVDRISEYLVYEIGVIVSDKNSHDEIARLHSTITEKYE